MRIVKCFVVEIFELKVATPSKTGCTPDNIIDLIASSWKFALSSCEQFDWLFL